MGVLVGSLAVGVGAAAWWSRPPRLETVKSGPVRALGVSVGKEIPTRFGPWRSLTTPGFSPVRLFFQVPHLARDIRAASAFEWQEPNVPPRGRIAARLLLPNGSTAPLDVQRDDDRLLVDLRGDIPPALPTLSVEVFLPERPVSRFRIQNPHTGVLAFDMNRRIARDGIVSGEAGWQVQENGSAVPALFCRLKIADFSLRKDETGEFRLRAEGPFAERGHEPWVKMAFSMGMDGGRREFSQWSSTPYAAYVKGVRARGTVRRYRFFDETIDFGVVPLRPRHGADSLAHDLEPNVPRSRSLSTAGGLRLTLSSRATEDSMHFGSGLNVSIPLEVDRSSVTRGLPPDMARLAARSPVEISVKPFSRKEEWFNSIDYDPRLREPNTTYPRYVTFGETKPRKLEAYPLRLRVRRQVLVEAIPFDLTLPVVGPRHAIPYRRGGAEAGGSFE